MSAKPHTVPTGALDFEIFVNNDRKVITLDLISTQLRIETLEAKHGIVPGEYNAEGTFAYASEFAELLQAETGEPITSTAAIYITNVVQSEWLKFNELMSHQLDEPESDG